MTRQYIAPAVEVLSYDMERSILAISDGNPIVQPDSFYGFQTGDDYDF